jgi:hypothetical protein
VTNASAIFKTQPVEGLPVPMWIAAIMVVSFALPLLVIPMTFNQVTSNPWVLLFWLAAPFPLTMLYLLRRLFTRFAIALYADGSVEIVQPFSRCTIAAGKLRSVIAMRQQMHLGEPGMRTSIPWLYFYDAKDQQITHVSPAAFRAEDIAGFLRMLAERFPAIGIEQRS